MMRFNPVLVKRIQEKVGVTPDGVFGGETLEAVARALEVFPSTETPSSGNIGKMAWGAKVSPDFKTRVYDLAKELGMPMPQGADWLMACMAFESGETFSSSVKNAAGSGATGLIQFMPQTAAVLGTTTQELAAMTPLSQLNYVRKYFMPYKGKLKSLDDVYMAILWPVAVGKQDEYALFTSQLGRSKAYLQNAGLDTNKDGVVTKHEAAGKVYTKLAKGLSEGFIG